MNTQRKTTSKDLARELGLAQSTISMALRDNSTISPKTRELVKEAARRMGFIPDSVASAMKTGRNNVVGLIVPCFSISYFSEMLGEVESSLREAGYHCLLGQSMSNVGNMDELISFQLSQKISGLIICPVNSRERADIFLKLQRMKIPFVLMDMEMEAVNASFVGSDNVRCGFMATEHLISLGHKDILFLTGYRNASTAWHREEGYRNAMLQYGLELREDLIVKSNFTFEHGFESVGRVLDDGLRFTGVVCVSDNAAIGTIEALKLRGFKVPDDISVIGCSNLEISRFMTPKLSTIDQKAREIGRMASKTLLGMLHEGGELKCSLLVKPELVVRESTGRVKKGISQSS